MKKIVLSFLAVLTLLFFCKHQILGCIPTRLLTSSLAYMQIKDLHHPTQEDYCRLQHYLKKGKRPELERLGDCRNKVRHLKIFGKPFESEILHINCEKSENCIITYASFNKNFSGGCKRLIEKVSASDYKGDFFYRIGGWPNVEEGDLKLAHVPFSFKACLFREAKRLGYKRVLWLDTSITPIASLNDIFSQIEKNGYFVMGNGHTVGPYFNATAAKALNVSFEESFKIPSCSSGLVGFDLTSERSLALLEDWYQAACDPDAFFSPRSDQSAISILLYKHGMTKWASIDTLAHGKEKINAQTLFLIDRGFVQKWKD